jgi:Zn-dependent protease with chaperone function
MQQVAGTFYFAASSQCCAAQLQITASVLQIYQSADQQLVWQGTDFSQGADLPGLAQELRFSDGSYFIPADLSFRLSRQLLATQNASLATRLEQHQGVILLSVLLVPLLLWWLTMVGMPKLAVSLLPWLPQAAVQAVDKQTLQLLDQTLLEPSKLPAQEQQQWRQQWLQAMQALPANARVKVDIQFRAAAKLGPNAFALPAGTLVFTDQLVQLLRDKPDALLAVFLHEAGHVRHQHGLTLLVQSTATTVMFAMLFSDLEGLTETLLGTGSSLLQQSFSRQMESQADDFATSQLLLLGKATTGFVDAMQAIQQAAAGQDAETIESWTRYLSSHPSSSERIEQAKAKQQPTSN